MSDERTLGEHSARLDALEEGIKEIRSDVKQVLAQMAEAKGGWMMFMMVGGISATIGGIISKYLPFK